MVKQDEPFDPALRVKAINLFTTAIQAESNGQRRGRLAQRLGDLNTALDAEGVTGRIASELIMTALRDMKAIP